MTRIRRGGFIFWTSVADHSPRHVHVFLDGRLVVKWDLEEGQPMQGRASRSLRKLIRELQDEGEL